MTTNASKREFADRIRRFVRTQQFQSNCWYYEENSPPKWLNSNLSVSSEPLWVLSFFVFQLFRPTIPSHIWQTPSILPQLPTHASRTMRNVRFWGLRSYGSPSGPRNVSRRNPAIFQTNGQIAHIRAHISPTIHATVTNVSSADLYSYGLHVWFVQCPIPMLLEFLFVPDCASSMVARSH